MSPYPEAHSLELETPSVQDAKLVTLARGTKGRIGAVQGAAVRDDDGRTGAAAAVNLPFLDLIRAGDAGVVTRRITL